MTGGEPVDKGPEPETLHQAGDPNPHGAHDATPALTRSRRKSYQLSIPSPVRAEVKKKRSVGFICWAFDTAWDRSNRRWGRRSILLSRSEERRVGKEWNWS